MSNVRTHIRSVINSSRRRRVVSLSLFLFCLAAAVRLVSIEAAGSTSKGFISPNPPSGLIVSDVSSTSLRLQWQDNSSNETSFSIYRCQGASCTPFGSIASVGADTTTFTNTGLLSGTTYGYYVIAVGKGGRVSPASNTAWATTSSAASPTPTPTPIPTPTPTPTATPTPTPIPTPTPTPTPADRTAPTVPSGLTATAASSSQINLSWSAATDSGGSGLAGYRVYQSGSQVASTASTGYDQPGLSPNIQYCFTVAAYDYAGNVSGQSVQACATTQSISTGSGSYVWSKNFGGALSTDNVTVTSTGVDSSGNIIVAGYFQGNVNFGGGTVSTVGGQDIFIAKYSSTGAYLWSKVMGSVADDYAHELCVDRSGNIIVTGSFNYSVDFGGGVLNSASPGFSDIFLVKYSAAGVHQWSRQLGDIGNDIGYGVTADAAGNVVVTGSFAGSVDFGGGRLTSNLNSNDIFVAKYSATGVHSWSRAYGSTGDDHGNAVATDASGNVVVTGYFNNTIDFGGGPLTSAGMKEIFLLELNSFGQHVWSKRFGGTSIDVANAVAIDGGGNIVITGFFYGTVDFGGGPLTSSSAAKVFLAKYNSLGNHIWSKLFSGSVVADNAIALGLAVDGSSNILITGYFQGSANFGGQTLTSAGSQDVFAAKYSAAGTHSWSQRFGGPGLDQGTAVVADSGNNMILSGYFSSNVSFGGPSLTNLYGSDLYVVKLAP